MCQTKRMHMLQAWVQKTHKHTRTQTAFKSRDLCFSFSSESLHYRQLSLSSNSPFKSLNLLSAPHFIHSQTFPQFLNCNSSVPSLCSNFCSLLSSLLQNKDLFHILFRFYCISHLFAKRSLPSCFKKPSRLSLTLTFIHTQIISCRS